MKKKKEVPEVKRVKYIKVYVVNFFCKGLVFEISTSSASLFDFQHFQSTILVVCLGLTYSSLFIGRFGISCVPPILGLGFTYFILIINS